jgi:hypothetical protein
MAEGDWVSNVWKDLAQGTNARPLHPLPGGMQVPENDLFYFCLSAVVDASFTMTETMISVWSLHWLSHCGLRGVSVF